MTADNALTTDAILDAFSSFDRGLPRAALQQAASRWDEGGPVLLDLLIQAASSVADPPDRTLNILTYALYLMAQVRETRAYLPLCALAKLNERFDVMLGDAITTDFNIMLARVYDGDPAPLRDLIESPEVDEFTRDAAFGALAWLTATGRIDPDDTMAYLRQLYATLQPQAESYVWVGWQRAIANLGFTGLEFLVEDAFARGWIGDHIMSLEHFRSDLKTAQSASSPAEAFEPDDQDDGCLDDVARLLSSWPAFAPARPRAPSFNTPVRNPYRNVGRNDPCPCGSGRKFKKCCLEAVA